MPELVAGCDVILGNEEDAERTLGSVLFVPLSFGTRNLKSVCHSRGPKRKQKTHSPACFSFDFVICVWVLLVCASLEFVF